MEEAVRVPISPEATEWLADATERALSKANHTIGAVQYE